MDRYILASQSPRRRELLGAVIRDYEVIPSEGEEIVSSEDPAEVVRELSRQKAVEVASRVSVCEGDRVIVIGADTVVAVDGKILGKPADKADAARMIGLLQGREHHVFTGVTVCWKGSGAGDVVSASPSDTSLNSAADTFEGTGEELRNFSFIEETAVDVFPMNRGEIEGYVSLREPYDKAGAYGIQGAFCVFIRGIRGDYNNVVGLPVARLYHEMAAHGLL